jgi:hypothetical protein
MCVHEGTTIYVQYTHEASHDIHEASHAASHDTVCYSFFNEFNSFKIYLQHSSMT